jgi:hypothetical protein
VEIVELAADEALAHEEELAQLLLDAHRSSMSLGLLGGRSSGARRRSGCG